MIKILVVDDEPSLVEMVKKRLESLNYLVMTASNGLDALSSVKSYNPDLILLDILMPKMDGYRFLEELRKLDGTAKHTPVIVLTARKQMKSVFASDKGVRYFIEKPFESADVIKKIEIITSEIQQQNSKVVSALLIGMDWGAMRPLKTLLESRKCMVFTATDASKAVEQAVKHQPSIIFCASLLAGMDVLALSNLFHDMPSTKHVPFVVYDTAGHLTAKAAEQLKATLVIDYKNHDQLVTRVDDFLRDYFMKN